MNIFIVLGVIFAMSFLVESTVEYVFGTPFDKIPKLTPYKWALMYLSGAVGIAGAFIYQFDLLNLLFTFLSGMLPAAEMPAIGITWYGITLTGIAISRGANYLHDFVTKFFVKPAAPETGAGQ